MMKSGRRHFVGSVTAAKLRCSSFETEGLLIADADELETGEDRILDLVAAGATLDATLRALALLFETRADGMLASVLLVEGGGVMRHVAAPSLPAGWERIVDGEPIGADRGSCGTAAYTKEPVIVTDIASDARWERYRAPALGFGLRAC